MFRRSPSTGMLVGDGPTELHTPGRLPPRSPLTSATGHRTPPTCPSSPLMCGQASGPPLRTPTGGAGGARSSGNTPARPRSLSCQALSAADLPPVDLAQSRLLTNVVSSVFESNLTAESCFASYGRMHAAPALLGHTAHHAVASTSAAGVIHAVRSVHPVMPPGGLAASRFGSSLARDPGDLDFGLATCLATPTDPGPGLRRRVAPLPATTTTGTAAARSAAHYKLSSANDILTETSRFGDWVRRQGRRMRLQRVQRLLSELAASAALGRLTDDCLLDTDPHERGRPVVDPGRHTGTAGDDCLVRPQAVSCEGGSGQQGQGQQLEGSVDYVLQEELSLRPMLRPYRRVTDGEEEEAFPARSVVFRDDMALIN